MALSIEQIHRVQGWGEAVSTVRKQLKLAPLSLAELEPFASTVNVGRFLEECWAVFLSLRGIVPNQFFRLFCACVLTDYNETGRVHALPKQWGRIDTEQYHEGYYNLSYVRVDHPMQVSPFWDSVYPPCGVLILWPGMACIEIYQGQIDLFTSIMKEKHDLHVDWFFCPNSLQVGNLEGTEVITMLKEQNINHVTTMPATGDLLVYDPIPFIVQPGYKNTVRIAMGLVGDGRGKIIVADWADKEDKRLAEGYRKALELLLEPTLRSGSPGRRPSISSVANDTPDQYLEHHYRDRLKERGVDCLSEKVRKDEWRMACQQTRRMFRTLEKSHHLKDIKQMVDEEKPWRKN
ncbi:MAG: hypothetical protein M0Z41_16405 [Peptococcaceae bacterium]|jgi:hypothetical protein|nr:hypothetical protein [Peptococcaceae bacterium]